MSSNVGGGLAGSSTQRVWATPEPPVSSSAETVAWTFVVYQPFEPFGEPGLRLIVVVVGVASVVVFKSTETSFKRLLAETRSSLPSPFKSAIAAASENAPPAVA